MDFESLYTFVLFAAGIFSLVSAIQGKSIEAAENPRLSKTTSRIFYTVTGILLIVFAILRLQ